MVFARTLDYAHVAGFDQQVKVGRSYVGHSFADGFAVAGMNGFERASTRQDTREQAVGVRRGVHNNEDGSVKVGQLRAELLESFYAAGRCANYDDVAIWHSSLPA